MTFATPFLLPADHYFFVPQVQLDNGDFFWLSATKTIPAPADLQSWTRDAALVHRHIQKIQGPLSLGHAHHRNRRGFIVGFAKGGETSAAPSV